MANFVLTQQYDTSSESDNDMEIDQQNTEEKKTIRRKHCWVKDQSFSDDEQAQATIQEEKQWSRYYSNKNHDGIKVHYRCNQVKFRGKQCDAGVYLYYPNDSDKVLLFRTTNEHNHTNSKARKFLSQEAKEKIEELFDLKLKPKKIYEILQERNFEVTRTQINNYLTQVREKKLGPSTLSLGQLESLYEEKSMVPQCEDEPFIVSFIIKYEDDIDAVEDVEGGGDKFRFVISTKRLLKLGSISTRLHADATYKLNWQGFPVLIVGTSDFDRKLHPFGLAVCSDEKQQDFEFIFQSISDGVEKLTELKFAPEVLVADGSGAIRNAFTQVFNKNKMVMCWAHMRRNVVKRLKSIHNTEIKNEILDDIDKLQLCESETVFRNASSLFMKKWRTREEDFSKYFENEWLITLGSWYEGYNDFTPSTNNALEAVNRVIKDEHTFRERHTVSRFFTIANEIVNKWSKFRNQNQADPVIFSTEPTITLKKWTDAYHFAKSSKSVLQIQTKRKGFTDYYIPAGEAEAITKTEIQKYKRKRWTSFDQFKDLQFGIWKVTLSDNASEWQHGICNCPSFFKEYICKHVVGMSIRLKFCRPPSAAKDIPLGEKRKRGRPRKATKALLTQ